MESAFKTEKAYCFEVKQSYGGKIPSKTTTLTLSPSFQQLIIKKAKKEKQYNISDIIRYKRKSKTLLSLRSKKYFVFQNDMEMSLFIGIMRDIQLFGIIASGIYHTILSQYEFIDFEGLSQMLTDNDINTSDEVIENIIRSLGQEPDFFSFFRVYRSTIASTLPQLLTLWSKNVISAPPIGERSIEDYQRISIMPKLYDGEYTVSYLSGVCKMCEIESKLTTIHGMFILTNLRLIFPSLGSEPPTYSQLRSSIYVLNITKFELIRTNEMIITTKDTMTTIHFYFNSCDDESKMLRFVDELYKRVRVNAITSLFVRSRSLPYDKGWNNYAAFVDYKRLKMDNNPKFLSVTNYNYGITETYPRQFYISHGLDVELLEKVRLYRKLYRIPIITWTNPKTSAVLVRSAQPKPGLLNFKCKEDITLLNLYRTMPLSVDSKTQSYTMENIPLYIFDARSSSEESTDKVKGGGRESNSRYDNVIYNYLNLPSLSSITDAFIKMGEAYSDRGITYTVKMADSKWLNYQSRVIEASIKVANVLINEECSALCQCTYGMDRSALLCSTVEFLIDPYYRTLEGFAILIEKEWCYYGFPFQDRCAHGKVWPNPSFCPLFVMWLDMIHQFVLQYNNEIEFNNELLQYLVTHTYSCVYGNFLYNCMEERDDFQIEDKTLSIWIDVFAPNEKEKYINPSYNPRNKVITPKYSLASLELWKDCYMKYIYH